MAKAATNGEGGLSAKGRGKAPGATVLQSATDGFGEAVLAVSLDKFRFEPCHKKLG